MEIFLPLEFQYQIKYNLLFFIMKRKLLFPIIILASLFFLQSCAVTDDGDDSNAREKYYGTWNVSDQASRLNYSVTITANPSNSSEILLNNFADLNSSAIGLIVDNIVVIDNQPLNDDYSVVGTGKFINNNKLEFSFDLNDGIDSESRDAIYTK